MPAEFPEVTYQYPVLANGPVAAARPDLIIDWSTDVRTPQFSESSTLNLLITVEEASTGNEALLEYVSYDAQSRRLTVRPVSALNRNELFTVTIDKGVISSPGRSSKSVFRWQFRTDVGAFDGTTLYAPSDYSVQEEWPVFSWSTPTTGVVNYVFELDNRLDFSSPLYTNTTTATSLIPTGSFTDNQTYFWRVLAYTATATATYSPTRQFWYGTIRRASEESRQTWEDDPSFALNSGAWRSGASNLSAWPSVGLTFSAAISTGYASHVQFVRRSLGPRTDQRLSFAEATVEGTWALSADDTVLTFTPTETLAANTRYELRVLDTLPNGGGTATLGADQLLYFTGPYSPMYATLDNIRSRFLSAESNVPDDLINYYIYQASLEANAKYYGYAMGGPIPGAAQYMPESIVRDSSNISSYGVGRWVEALATYNMIKAIVHEMMRLVDSKRRLGDYEFTLGPGFLKAIEMAKDMAQEELEQWENYLVPSSPRVAVAGQFWSPCMRNFDWSIRNLEGPRGVPF